MALIAEAVAAGSRKRPACEILGLSLRTVVNWEKQGLVDKRTTREFVPRNKLSEEERALVLAVVNSKEFRDRPPEQIVPTLADRGIYLASESTMYRILRDEEMVKHRQTSRPPTHERPKTYIAYGPGEVLTWDITYMRREIKGMFFYLYMIMDIFSRKIVGWEVHENESAEHASKLISRVHRLEKLEGRSTVLHSDNGGPMKGACMLATLQRLGITASFSRPAVSNDNPFSEALFRTLKYRPGYPNCFESIEHAREWVEAFVTWYNYEHLHATLGYVTPHARHEGLDGQILAGRRQLYANAHSDHPERWSGETRAWELTGPVELNRGDAGRGVLLTTQERGAHEGEKRGTQSPPPLHATFTERPGVLA